MRRFRSDPLGFLEGLAARDRAPVFRLPWGGWCVRDTELALTVLKDPRFNEGRSAFFGDLLPSRPAQIAFGRDMRRALLAQLPAYRDNMAEAVDRLPGTTSWPATGPDLVFRSTADWLLHPEAAPPLRRAMHEAVHSGVLVRQPAMGQRARAEVARARLVRATLTHVAERRRQGGVREPRDLLDTVISASPAGADDRTVADLYRLIQQSVVRNVGYALSWSLLLDCLHATPVARGQWPADHSVREAARHRPMVWMVGRRLPHPGEFGGVQVPAGATLAVSPYLLHHDEDRWSDPHLFRPDRWSRPQTCGPYLPFSDGPFTCAAAQVAQTMISVAFGLLSHARQLSTPGAVPHPVVTDAAIPRPFVLHRTTKVPTPTGRR